MGRPLDEDIIIKILERWQKAFKENSHYVSASDLSLVIKDVRELPTIQSVATDTNVGDTISRKAAIDALRRCQTYLYDARDPELKIELSSADAAIKELPTIQPEKAQLSQQGTTSDLISRTATIDAVDDMVEPQESEE